MMHSVAVCFRRVHVCDMMHGSDACTHLTHIFDVMPSSATAFATCFCRSHCSPHLVSVLNVCNLPCQIHNLVPTQVCLTSVTCSWTNYRHHQCTLLFLQPQQAQVHELTMGAEFGMSMAGLHSVGPCSTLICSQLVIISVLE